MSSVAENRPAFTSAEAEAFVAEHWGRHGSASELPSDRDQNFQINSADGSTVLKIASVAETHDVLVLQNDAMTLLAGDLHHVNIAKPLPAHDGSTVVELSGPDDCVFRARLVEWISGTPLADVTPHSPSLIRSLGEMLAAVDQGLADFQNPTRRRLRWDLKQCLDVCRECGPLIDDPARKGVFDASVQRFAEHARPLVSDLREGWVHNDANDHNVLVCDTPAQQHVCGLIDFGDMTHTWVVSEVAIACAYIMLSKQHPVEAACHLIDGYHARFPLEPRELEVLFDLIRMRLCMSVAICAEQKRAEPDNAYLRVSEQPAWDLLHQLHSVSPEWATAMFRHACGLEPCSTTPQVTSWLKQANPHPLTDLDCSANNLFVHDLSVSSSEPAACATSADVDEFDRLLRERRRQQEAQVGIGRYDEPRLCYLSDQFATDGGSRRTIHIGLDIFAAAGTSVFAPLDGTVHSVANNNLPLDYGPTIILQHQTDDGIEFLTLYGHLSADSIADIRPGDPVAHGQLLARFGDATVNGGWPPHLHFQIITNMLGKTGDFPGVAPANERKVWLSLSPNPNLIARLPIDGTRYRAATVGQLVARRRERLGPSLSLSYQEPLHLVRGSGSVLFDDAGRSYLDTVNNVAHVGHCHPRVVDAAQRQMQVLNTNTRYLHDAILSYAERLAAKFPSPLDVCFFVNSGSEANELALRLARAHTAARDIVVLDSGYHGNTAACVDVSAYKFDGPGGDGPPAHVHKVPTPDPYRVPAYRDGAHAAAEVRSILAKLTQPPAAFLTETIVSCGGQIVPADGYLAAAFAHIRGAGGVCIADEVQTGFGRVGSHFWAFETQGVVPDIVTLGKPIGNGHPLGAVVTTREIADSFANGMEYFNTCGGNPVSCAVGLAVLDVIEDEGLQQRAADVGGFFLSELRALQREHPLIGDVRGRGLFLGIELVRHRSSQEPAAEEAAYVVERFRQKRILASTDGPRQNVIKIKPPLVFSRADVNRYCETLSQILSEKKREEKVSGPFSVKGS